MDQYKQVGESAIAPIVKDKHEKKEDELTQKIVELNARIDSQYKVIDKLVRDVKRLKDQISEVAGRISRG